MNVCYKCIGDSYLSDEIRTEAKRALCEFCGKRRQACTLDALSQRVRDVLESHYSPHQDEYGADDGQPVVDLILNLLDCEESIAEAVRAHISQTTAWAAHDGGYSDPFGSETCYIERPADIYNFQETWGFFRSEIRSRSRYFSETARHALQEIFGDLTTLTNWSREPVIQTIGTGTKMTASTAGVSPSPRPSSKQFSKSQLRNSARRRQLWPAPDA
ncbi:HEPN-associated N-terminal domain-containing protein [Mesorhizobium sp. B2-6-2]|uniref:HEPN-associated N-terminal domain-containing protein n=1 Tax=Mesorhizobium sp. B2-6-2 TaxID=2589915 RepID=UPI00112C793B|nr:HEPN-associated N-terminal domain-containing protein [Mesorhizobium sp. B2-6-2]TPJ72806.1 hypothetical protein FJ419_27195 [Mesorhizobium sp. B2-6-2]